MKVDVLLGLQWGDEGKGKVVDVLTRGMMSWLVFKVDLMPVIRLNLKDKNMFFVLSLPEYFKDDKVNIIGNGVVLDPCFI